MKQLSEAIEGVASHMHGDPNAEERLTKAAAKWASFVVLNLTEPLLSKGLNISRAIATFTAAMSEIEEKSYIQHPRVEIDENGNVVKKEEGSP